MLASGRMFSSDMVVPPVWRVLKDFIQDRLQLPWAEFNRVPVAGVTNIARLSEMLDAAAIALLVMTAEDELADGGIQARMNVIHEAGLFYGSAWVYPGYRSIGGRLHGIQQHSGAGTNTLSQGKRRCCFRGSSTSARARRINQGRRIVRRTSVP